jgi:hypothetical protein
MILSPPGISIEPFLSIEKGKAQREVIAAPSLEREAKEWIRISPLSEAITFMRRGIYPIAVLVAV